MNIVDPVNLACPIDGKRLELTDRQLVCESGHSFDIARQGYVNLLPVQHKRSKQPGDSKAMVLARSQFLDSGVYKPIADKLTKIISALIINDNDGDNDYCFLDAGCGEGYYFDRLQTNLAEMSGENKLSFIGLDISKEAVLQATKRNRRTRWLVGTNRQPPVLDETVDVILCLFGFFSGEGFYKVLKPGAKVVLVDPGVEHLQELREIIYTEKKAPDTSDVKQKEYPGFELLDTQRLQFNMRVTEKNQLKNLLQMTPHFYRASKQGREAAGRLDKLALTVDVIFTILQKQ